MAYLIQPILNQYLVVDRTNLFLLNEYQLTVLVIAGLWCSLKTRKTI